MALFWPGMNADIEQTVANCGTCQMHRTANTKETLVNHPIPNLPWEMVASDLFTLDGRDYVLVVDYYSNYPEVEHLPDTRSGTVINKLKAILARHGKCLKFVSDNGHANGVLNTSHQALPTLSQMAWLRGLYRPSNSS